MATGDRVADTFVGQNVGLQMSRTLLPLFQNTGDVYTLLRPMVIVDYQIVDGRLTTWQSSSNEALDSDGNLD